MTFSLVNSDFMILFAVTIVMWLVFSEILSPDYDTAKSLPTENQNREKLSWIFSFVAWILCINFFVVVSISGC